MEASKHIAVRANSSLALTLNEVPQALDAILEPGARLDLVLLHGQSAAANHRFALKENSTLNLFYLTLQGDEVSQNMRVDILGKHAECNVFGFSAAALSQRFTSEFVVNHAVANCCSRQLFKQIAVNNAAVDFGGRVIVAKGAQRTDAQQTCRTLLLSETAYAHAQPQLEIYADDVKCSHGATVGQLDAEALFYLRSRGVGLAEAQQLLLLAFADEVVQRIPSAEAREKVGQMVAKKLSELL